MKKGKKSEVLPIPYFAASVFSNVEIFLNNTPIGSTNNLYPFRAYIEALLSFDKDVKNTQLAMSMFYPSEEKCDFSEEGLITDDCDKAGVKERYLRTRYSQPFETFSKLHLDVCHQNKYLLNKTNIKIKCYRSPTNFVLLAKNKDEKYKILFEEAFLYIRIVRLRESLRLAIESNLMKIPAQYPMKRVEARFFTHSMNSSNISESSLYVGNLPTRVCIGLIDTKALDGSLHYDPFHFQHFNMKKIQLRVNGRAIPTVDGIKLDPKNKMVVQGYASLFLGTGGFSENSSLLSYDEYLENSFLILFDLTADMNNEFSHIHPPTSGTISLNINLEEPTSTNVTVIALLEFESLLKSDQDRNYWINE